ncbi:ABC transporter permease subunit [Paenibacillus sp. P96]|uniref:ABC transporter permease subunit n=1 Tax=Paenibacillus zeirhizosphaerae TaxID=2987519 RepID=A0ABT9FUT8_9BACL|nr:ABC transporter permease subunit [Paenibacillus sp. P96]MDP4098497.1 ABC transporter permease subunit [Paenibacillus sp. P96]
MKRMMAICRKELHAYFWTPASYFILAVYMLISGLFFYTSFVFYQPSIVDYRLVLGDTLSLLMFVIPLLTMRLMAEEFRQGTDELLLTSPASAAEIILGKYLAALAMMAVLVLLSLLYPVMMSYFGPLDYNTVFTSALGLFLLGAGMMAVGLFASTLSQHQMVAAVAGIIMLVGLWMLDSFGSRDKLKEWLEPFSLSARFDGFVKGLLNGADVLFYITLAGLFLLLSIQVVERKRWR